MVPESSDLPIEFEVEGQKYKMTRLTPDDFGELRLRIKGEKIHHLNKLIQQNLIKAADYPEQLSRLLDKDSTILDDYRLLLTELGLYFALWLSLRKHQPQLTTEKLREQIPQNEALALVKSLSGMVLLSKEERT